MSSHFFILNSNTEEDSISAQNNKEGRIPIKTKHNQKYKYLELKLKKFEKEKNDGKFKIIFPPICYKTFPKSCWFE